MSRESTTTNRVYDYLLGGKDNFAADREAAERAMAATPTIVPGVRANRRFPGRAVRYMAETGIRQFLDIGTGIPTANNTHEVAQSVAPAARVVYVDNSRYKSGCAHAREAGGLPEAHGGRYGKNHVTRCKRWGRQAGYEPAGADTAEPGIVVPGWMR